MSLARSKKEKNWKSSHYTSTHNYEELWKQAKTFGESTAKLDAQFVSSFCAQGCLSRWPPGASSITWQAGGGGVSAPSAHGPFTGWPAPHWPLSVQRKSLSLWAVLSAPLSNFCPSTPRPPGHRELQVLSHLQGKKRGPQPHLKSEGPGGDVHSDTDPGSIELKRKLRHTKGYRWR